MTTTVLISPHRWKQTEDVRSEQILLNSVKSQPHEFAEETIARKGLDLYIADDESKEIVTILLSMATRTVN